MACYVVETIEVVMKLDEELEPCTRCESNENVQFDVCIGAPFEWLFGVKAFCENCDLSTEWKDAKDQFTGTNDDKEIENLYKEAAEEWSKLET